MKSPLTIIVTGSSGLIGYAVCEALALDGHHVIGFDRPGIPHPPPDAENVPCDITSDQSLADAIAHVRRKFGDRIASVIHLAAYYDFSGEPSPLYEKVTVRGTQSLLSALLRCQVEQFIFSSTMLVHAPCKPGQKINEDWPIDPKWDYPKSKVDTEQVILDHVQRQGGPASAILLRIAGVYDDRCHSVPIAHQIQRIHERRLTARVFPGDISTGQSFLHLDDLVQLFAQCIERRERLPRELPLLAGEPETLSYDELQRTLAWLIHGEEDWDTTQIPKLVAKAGAWVQDKVPGVEEPFIKPWMIDLADDHYELDLTRAQNLLGWRPARTLRETLLRMVEALKSDPAAFYRDNKIEGAPPMATEPAAAPGKTPETTNGQDMEQG